MIHSSAQIHPNALIETNVKIGENTKVWAFAHILPEVQVGADCNICDHTFIETGVVLGDRVTLKSGVYLWSGVEVENDVFVGPCATFTNDRRPRSQQYLPEYPKLRLLQGCSIGANATILPGVTIGRWAMVGAGSVVTRDVPDYALIFGNPARSQGWVCQCGSQLKLQDLSAQCPCGCRYQLNVNGNKLMLI